MTSDQWKTWNDAGGNAFPLSPVPDRQGQDTRYSGMTVRDYFAGQALIGLTMSLGSVAAVGLKLAPEVFAGHCYAIADAMLKEKEK